MIEVKMYLYTPWEVAVIHEGMSIIHKAREAQAAGVVAAQVAEAAQLIRGAAVVEAEVVDHTTAGGALSPEEEAAVIASIGPAGVMTKAAAPKGPTLLELEAVAQVYLTKHGLVKAQQIVSTFGASQIKKVPEDQWPALMAAFQAGS